MKVFKIQNKDMKITIALAVFLIMAFHHAIAQKTPTIRKIEQEVRNAIVQLNDATTTGDMEKTESLIANEYFHTDIYGRVQDKKNG